MDAENVNDSDKGDGVTSRVGCQCKQNQEVPEICAHHPLQRSHRTSICLPTEAEGPAGPPEWVWVALWPRRTEEWEDSGESKRHGR